MVVTRNHRKKFKKEGTSLLLLDGFLWLWWAHSLMYLQVPFLVLPMPFWNHEWVYNDGSYNFERYWKHPERCVVLAKHHIHWIGGMGLLGWPCHSSTLGIGGMQLLLQAPGPGGDKLHPKLRTSAKRLWLIYVGYTLRKLCFFGLQDDLFDAINHSLSNWARADFPQKNATSGLLESPTYHSVSSSSSCFGRVQFCVELFCIQDQIQ